MTRLLKQIAREDLVVGRHYAGRGRHGNVGLWEGRWFLVIDEKLGETVVKKESYNDSDHSCFQPFLEIDEGRVVEPFGSSGWNAHYGKAIEYGAGAQPYVHGSEERDG